MLYEPFNDVDFLFSRSWLYRELLSPRRVQESGRRFFPYSERHLQALWFDDSLRPNGLKTSCGESMIVENPGRWNLEAGPDFLGAVLLIGREKRRVVGDVEIHISSKDWKNHGHHTDPRYDGVRFHITWFPGTAELSLFPVGTVHSSLSELSSVDLESIDVSAYPYQEPRAVEVFPMAGKTPEERIQLLESAGEERIRQKTVRLAMLMQERGDAQALYEETAAALGYKNNKTPFRELARRVSLDRLSAVYGSDWEIIYAVLLGLSGLLPKQPGANWSGDSKTYFRSLWDGWWREEHKWDEVDSLTKSDWNFSGLRPLNHPVRRLCALAQWVAGDAFSGAARSERLALPKGREFHCLENCFWSNHLGWSGNEQKAGLVGPGRLQAIELNVWVPYRLAKGDETALENLRVEPMNSIIRETAYTLLGPDHTPALYRTALARQGLIQLFHDFILTGMNRHS